MVHREVNPLEERHMALSARFKSAWALHQLLIGMQRLNSGAETESLAATFQSLYARLKSFSESLHGPSTGHDTLAPALAALERETEELRQTLLEREESVSPSDLRRFLTQVRTLDDRILIEVVRFYLEIHQRRRWDQDRLDKIDFLLSRLAEKVAGRNLKGDRVRLEKVLHGLFQSAGEIEVPASEIEDLTSTLQDMRSEVRWVKTIDELNESRLLDVYRALKREMAERMFHPRILPVVIEVNNAFRCKIDELREREEARLLDEYQKLSRLHQDSLPGSADLEVDLTALQDQFTSFRERARAGNVRLGEILQLGQSLREVAGRIELQSHASVAVSSVPQAEQAVSPGTERRTSPRVALVPEIESLQPHWSELLQALAGLGGEFSPREVEQDSSLASYRLEVRELEAFRRTVGSEPANVGLEQFILAAATLRYRLCQDVVEIRDLRSRDGGSIPTSTWLDVRESVRLADAYSKHYTHLVEQAVFDGQTGEARDFLRLKTRLDRELSGLVLLLSDVGATSNLALDDERAGERATREVGSPSAPAKEPFENLF